MRRGISEGFECGLLEQTCINQVLERKRGGEVKSGEE